MNDQYLWDRTGPPDPEIEALEAALAPLAYRPRPKVISMRPRVWIPAAVAAAVVLATAVALLRPLPVKTDWQIGGAATYVGQVVRTGNGSVTLDAEEIGRVDVAPGSEIRIAASTRDHQRLSLLRGTMHALIWAPPQTFVVDTNSARAVDLGCEYTLTSDEHGSGHLRVETGWVAFQNAGLESFIPAGAACSTHRDTGPGLPYFEDASEVFRAAVGAYDNVRGAPGLNTILREARSRDALTLWHLLTRTSGERRAAVFDRFAALVKIPASVQRDAVLAGDHKALDECWNALGLEDTDWWREWKRRWN